jgi:hypothetical protein
MLIDRYNSNLVHDILNLEFPLLHVFQKQRSRMSNVTKVVNYREGSSLDKVLTYPVFP